MADNVVFTSGVAGTYTAAADEASYSSDTVKIQLVRRLKVTGAEGSKTVGSLLHHRLNTGTDNVSVAAFPAELIRFRGLNTDSAVVYAKFHNTAGTPTIGSGVVMTIAMPPGVPVNELIEYQFSTGIGMTLVYDLADSGTTVVTASKVLTDTEYTRTS